MIQPRERRDPHPDLAEVVAGREAWEATVSDTPGPPPVVLSLGGVPAEVVVPTEGSDDGWRLLHLHGGGYNSGSPRTHRDLARRLAASTGAPVYLLDYGLAPESPFPVALLDVVPAYRHLLADGLRTDRIVVGGDSSGGGLALATLVHLRDIGLPPPAASYLMSPWTDLTLSGDSIEGNQGRDTVVTRDGLAGAADLYLQGHRPDDPLASPLFADLSGLPPLFVQVGGCEILLDDSRRVVERARRADVEAVIDVWDDMQHVFQATPELPEAHAALDRLASWLHSRPPIPTG